MRTINVEEITKHIKEMCIEANHFLSKDMDTAMKRAVDTEESPLGKQILNQLQENLKIAAEDMIPICQDTGMAVIFIEIGQTINVDLTITTYVGWFTLASLIINELRSIIENFVEAGDNVPAVLTKGLEVAENAINKGEE